MRDDEYSQAAEIFIKLGVADNNHRVEYIKNSDIKDLGIYKIS